MAEAWYYVDSTTNSQQGPCTVRELGNLLASSSIGDSTLVWEEGQAGWEELSSVPSLYSQVRAASRGSPESKTSKTLPPLHAKPTAGGGWGGGRGGAYAAAQASAPVVQSMSGERLGRAMKVLTVNFPSKYKMGHVWELLRLASFLSSGAVRCSSTAAPLLDFSKTHSVDSTSA